MGVFSKSLQTIMWRKGMGFLAYNNSLGGLSHDPVPYDLNRGQAAS